MNNILIEDLANISRSTINFALLANSTVMISGANGFLPSYLVETLLYLNDTQQLNIKILALVRNESKAKQRFVHHATRKDIEFLVQDICTPILYSDSIDYIIHAASQASPMYYSSDPIGTQNANIIGTTNLLHLANEKKVKSFLFFSSGEVYGVLQSHQIPTKETDFGALDTMLLRSCYGESKRMGENICVCWYHQHQVPIKIVRPFHTYGPGMDLKDGRVFADFVANIVLNQDIEMKSDGSDIRAFCYTSDATIGFFKVLLEGKNGEAYNIGSDIETSILELATILTELFPEKKLQVIRKEDTISKEYVKSDIRRSCPDITKAKALHWQPHISIQDGFRRTILSYL